jgi:hypothetical protein
MAVLLQWEETGDEHLVACVRQRYDRVVAPWVEAAKGWLAAGCPDVHKELAS